MEKGQKNKTAVRGSKDKYGVQQRDVQGSQESQDSIGNQGGQRQDIMSKMIFGNHELCAQFLRDYVDLPFLRNVQPEDIEEYDQRYHFFDNVELNTDTVKKVKLRDGKIKELFIALIEHKSRPDYDVSMQLLQYITCIWYNWAKTEKKRLGGKEKVNKRKSFRYPPILPIVYYEGSENWTEMLGLKDRILLKEKFAPFIPDFQYIVVRNRDFSNEELLEKKDEISLIMLINKIQKREDFSIIRNIPAERMKGMLAHSSDSVLDIMAATIQSLCRKLNLPDEETARYVEKVKERDMGYLWENMEPMDIQAERQNTKEAREKLKQAEMELENSKDVINKQENLIQEKESVIQEKENVIQEKDSIIQKKQSVIEERDARIVELERELSRYKAKSF